MSWVSFSLMSKGSQLFSEDWYEDLNEVYNTLDPKDAVNEDDMQVDNRYMIAEEEKED